MTLSALTLLLLSGCGHRSVDPQPGPPAGWPAALNNFSMVWSAETGIDLARAPAVAVRAYIESFHLVYLTGDEKYLYPGFKQSVDHQSDLWPKTDKPDDRPWVGTEKNHILTIARSGREVTVKVCVYLYSAAARHSSGSYFAPVGDPGNPYAGIYPLQIVMTAPPAGTPALPPQAGPARTPRDDVFNGWRITHQRGDYFTATGWSQVDLDACAAKAPDPPKRRAEFVGGYYHPRSDFPTQPPYPGWPANTS
jgi:hypothetical protein